MSFLKPKNTSKDSKPGLDKLKKDKDVKSLPNKDMAKVKGGQDKRKKFGKGCGSIIPQ
ncbi:MAG: hypothetical protein R2795_12355 [Saprospiraceae bacterium]